ncbi:MAG: hypothetical protein VX901_07050 [Candidatus Poribacteria bacterium]|nr:hypothetical protein [Candidatus Poribacteria bacterium]
MSSSLKKSSYRSWLRASICCVLFCFFYQTTTVHALEKTNHLAPVMLIGGFGLQFAGALVGTSAQNSYDQYLYSVGSKMASHREKYKSRRNLSLVIKQTGIGLISLATLLSILDQAKIFSSPNKKVANAIRILPLHDPDQYKAAFILQRPF